MKARATSWSIVTLSLTVVLIISSGPGAVAANTHDLVADFSLAANPTPTGWQYSQAVDAGGGVVGPVTQDWNQPDFGPGQPGWEGITPPGPHAGWAKRIDNGNDTPNYDDPAGSVITHGPTSVLWKAPAGDTNRFADLSGSLWNIRQFGRSGAWRIYKNTAVLTQGTIDDSVGTSTSPKSLATGSGGAAALQDIPYAPGDSFRLEILEGDFVVVNFTVTTTNVGPDPDIATQPQPQSQIVQEGTNVSFSVVATGTQPFSYRWQLNGTDVPGATGPTLTLNSVGANLAGRYTVVVSNALGTKTSAPAVLIVDVVPPATPGTHDLATDFSLRSNPTDRGWQYSEALDAGGSVVGQVTNDWNASIFGPGQPGWAGRAAGAFAGWAKRVENGNDTPNLDDPVGTAMTHGPTSVLWKAPADDANKFADLSGSLWSIERNNRASAFKIWKNDVTLLTEGTAASGTLDSPVDLASGNGGADALLGVYYSPGDTFRLEILPLSGPGGSLQGPYGDLVGVNFTITTGKVGPDPAIATQPRSQKVVEGSDVTFTVVPVGTAPYTYQWQLQGSDLAGATSSTLVLTNVVRGQAGNYTVVVSNSKGVKTSLAAVLQVNPRPAQARGTRHDLAADFSLESNPTSTGWQYSESLLAGGGPVGPAVNNWNQPDFGAKQTGWQGNLAGVHAGWAKRIDNGNSTSTYDDPVGSIITHGPTSVLWTAPANDRGGLADITGGLWNIRHLNRPSNWKILKNDTDVLTEGTVDDTSGSSTSPLSLASGSGGTAALQNIPYAAGDSFRLEIAGIATSDFVAVNFTITTRQVHDLEAQFTLESNPTTNGWQYSRALAEGGGVVGPVTQNWNQPDFGAGQPGWQGATPPGPHAGWAQRSDNGNSTPTFDDPAGSVITHGNTSVLWKAPGGDPGGLADLGGGLWNLRHLGRSGTWQLWKNDATLLTQGTNTDSSGTSAVPLSLASGSGGAEALQDIPYAAGDSFRLEILEGDFVGVKFRVSTYAGGEGPRLSYTRSGNDIKLSWSSGILQSADEATGPWTNVPGATSPHDVAPTGARKFYRLRL